MKTKKKLKTALLIVELTLISIVLLSLFCFMVGSTAIMFASPEAEYSEWFGTTFFGVVLENEPQIEEEITNLTLTEQVVEKIKSHAFDIVICLIKIVIIYAICRVIRLIFAAIMKRNNRAKTILALLDGFVKYGCAIAIIFFILKAVGVNTGALIASVGVLTLVVGLGANALIADIIAGIFIIFENEYSVGEVISIDDFRGTVIEIGIRSTKLLDAAGNIKIINNGNIGDVVNLSRELSLAIADCDFPYDVPIEFVENIIKNNLDTIKERIPAIVEGPYYKGVCMYKDSNVTIKLVAKCNEDDRFQVQRDLLREYRILLTENDIDIAFPQVVINQPSVKEYKLSKKEKIAAQEFAKEQKELAGNLEEQQV